MHRTAARPLLAPGPRRWLLLGLTLAWLWASSAFTPWALSAASMMVFYDALFYARFALAGWWLVELGLLVHRSRPTRVAAAPLALALVLAVLVPQLRKTEAGLHVLLRFSLPALEQAIGDRHTSGHAPILADDQRRRIGAFLVDTWRLPCAADQPWLWLGRPFGAGSGINLALVRSQHGPPEAPDRHAFRFRSLGHGWWLAYQNPAQFFRPGGPASQPNSPCQPGETLDRHRQGLAFIEKGVRQVSD